MPDIPAARPDSDAAPPQVLRFADLVPVPRLLEIIGKPRRSGQATQQVIDGSPAFPVRETGPGRSSEPPGYEESIAFWRAEITASQAAIDTAHAAVCRINIAAADSGYSGSGFAVGPGLILTAWHVADEIFDMATGAILTPHSVDFSNSGIAGPSIAITRLAAKSRELGFALLEAPAGMLPFPAPLSLATPEREASVKAELIMNAKVFATGFPSSPTLGSYDPRNGAVFDGAYGEKCVLPGRFKKLASGGLEEITGALFESTYSSRPKCSGGPVCRFADGLVIGLHLKGERDVANYSKPAWEIVAALRTSLTGASDQAVLAAMNISQPPPA